MDPREEKLKSIIEEGKRAVVKSLQEIQNEFALRKDMFVKPSVIDFKVDSSIHPVIDNEAHNLTTHSTNQVLIRAGIPKNFADRL
ncbi:MAG: hypothetical protein QW051_05130, partial [Candidatus Aenigmatarchaeota archaeon]